MRVIIFKCDDEGSYWNNAAIPFGIDVVGITTVSASTKVAA